MAETAVTLEMLAERFLDPATPLACPSTNAQWVAILKYPRADPQPPKIYPESSLTLTRYCEEKLLEYLERCDGKFNFKVWASASLGLGGRET